MHRIMDGLGIVGIVGFATAFVACESEEVTAPPLATSSTSSVTDATSTSSDGGGGGEVSSTTGDGAGGQGGAGGDGGAGGMGQGGTMGQGGSACVSPAPATDITGFCGGSVVASSSGGASCIYCVNDTAGTQYEVECGNGMCACKIDGNTACTCQQATGQMGCTNSCCPEPWGASPNGGGGGAGGAPPTTVSTGTTMVTVGTVGTGTGPGSTGSGN